MAYQPKPLFSLLSSLCVAGGLISCGPAPQDSDNQTQTTPGAIALGAVFSQTSNVSLLGQEQMIGAQLAESYFNELGGIGGEPIEVIMEDGAGDEASTINAFNNLINRYKVVGIVGPTLSQQAFAADPIADRSQVPVLGPSNTAQGIPQIGEYIARVSSPVAIVAPNAVKKALELNPNLETVAVFYAQNDAFSTSESKTFQETVTDFGLELATVQKFQTTDTDFQTQATAAINLNPDLVIISGLVSDGGNLVKQLRELGYKGLIIGGNGLNTSNIFPICQGYCDGVLIAQAYSPELDNEINNAFRSRYRAQQGQEPPQFSAQAFTGIQVFVEALQRLNEQEAIADLDLSTLRQRLRDEVISGQYETVLGNISFTPEGEIIQEQFYVAQIEMDDSGTQGKFSFLELGENQETP